MSAPELHANDGVIQHLEGTNFSTSTHRKEQLVQAVDRLHACAD